jgi:RsiW-degrading membrane proteinase PrsW (M82 family)
MPLVLALIASLVPLVVLIALTATGHSLRRLAPLLAINVVWGMIATYVVLGPNDAMFAKFGVAMTVVVWAPIIEEVVKSLPLWWETATKRCWWFVDGALLGAACGAGFAIRETLFDMGKGDTADSVGLVVARSGSTNLMHMGTCAIVGAAFALAARRAWPSRLIVCLSGLLLGVLIHGTFNYVQQHVDGSLLTTLLGFGVIAVCLGVIALGAPITRYWAMEDLESEGVSLHEEHVLAGGPGTARALDEFSALYGHDAAETLNALITATRALGVAHHGGHDPARVAALTAEVERLRRELGPAGLYWLSATADMEGSHGLWQHLTHRSTTAPDH